MNGQDTRPHECTRPPPAVLSCQPIAVLLGVATPGCGRCRAGILRVKNAAAGTADIRLNALGPDVFQGDIGQMTDECFHARS